MRIDGAYNDVSINRLNSPDRVRTDSPEVKKQDVYNIQDTYEHVKAQQKVDFGGYNKDGKLLVKKSNKPADITNVNKVNFDSNLSSINNSKYVIKGVSDILNISEEDVTAKLKEKGLQVEDLAVPDKAAELSDEPKMKESLKEYAYSLRNGLMEETGMSEEQLMDFISRLREA